MGVMLDKVALSWPVMSNKLEAKWTPDKSIRLHLSFKQKVASPTTIIQKVRLILISLKGFTSQITKVTIFGKP